MTSSKNYTDMKIFAYTRVSTNKQDETSQSYEITEYAKKNGLQPLKFVSEVVSGKIPVKDRRLHHVLEILDEGDVLIVTELSRLGRNMVEILSIIEKLIQKGVRVHAIKGDYVLNDSLSSKILTTIMLMAAEIERELISERTRRAIASRKALGKPIGRPKGTGGKSKLDSVRNEIIGNYKKGLNVTALTLLYDASWPTMNKWLIKNGAKKTSGKTYCIIE